MDEEDDSQPNEYMIQMGQAADAGQYMHMSAQILNVLGSKQGTPLGQGRGAESGTVKLLRPSLQPKKASKKKKTAEKKPAGSAAKKKDGVSASKGRKAARGAEEEKEQMILPKLLRKNKT